MNFTANPQRVRDHLRWLVEAYGVDVFLLQECKNINVGALLPGYRVFQDRSSKDRAGSVVAVSKSIRFRRKRLRKGVEAPAGSGILNRWGAVTVLDVHGRRLGASSWHFPPARNPVLRTINRLRTQLFLETRRLPHIAGLDANLPVQSLTSRKYRAIGQGIVGLLVDRRIKVDRFSFGPKGPSDHKPVIAVLEL